MDTDDSSMHNAKVTDEKVENVESADQEDRPYDDSGPRSKLEKRLLLKQDFIILPLLSIMFFFAYLDRGQIGNARLMGLQASYKMNNGQYFNVLMMFYVGYMVGEFPFALLLRVSKPAYVYGFTIIAFGLFATCCVATRSYAALLVLRLLVGVAEAAAQTAFLYLSLWYKPDELAMRTAIFYGSTPLAGAFSGLISYGVQRNLDGVRGLLNWQWLFVIEGIPTMAWGILVALVCPAFPETVAKNGSMFFKREDERRLILQRTIAGRNVAHAKIEAFQIWIALKDIRIWLAGLYVAAPALCVAAYGAFLPTFIKEFGFDPLATQLYSIIPYAFATVTLFIACWGADHFRQKGLFLIGCLSISVTGFVLLLATTNTVALMAGACFVASGAYAGVILAATWNIANHGGYTKRAVSAAIVQIFIQCYSIISTQIYIKPPRFFLGHGVLLALVTVGLLAAVANLFIIKKRNAERDARAADFERRGELDPDMANSYEELCDYHPGYRYVM
ncbi:Uncharacterized protein BP5553_01536 [Venustampulla echinocandica]|uniref:Major facilitator superfamily (MFS) profile domain-containing protein n=1 Tax=Venustampulla echinocandica TaxID=2656787 RepID=A0A370U1A4_9HELO|nr:Uncharacterized protein BP5553_01536 [Venustampulla echinocandica]RDL41557.1 Uncharacterized protein BP5553_01536 [Venustampulla echinocandica]